MSRPTPPADQPASWEVFTAELVRLRTSVDGMAARLLRLEQTEARLEQSETARRALMAQTEHLLQLLEDSRRELLVLRQKPAAAGG